MKKVLIILGAIIVVGFAFSVYSGYQANEQAKIKLMKQQVEAQQKAADAARRSTNYAPPRLDLGQNNQQPTYEQPEYQPSQPIYNGPVICEKNVFGQTECAQKW